MTRVRFAPAPTGYLHIGGARTALFNWLYARGSEGSLVLRIEDTDKTRSTQEAVKNIIESLKWLGLDWDEGPYFQTERLEIYKEHAQKLIEEGKAHREGKAVRFKIVPQEVEIPDLIHGKTKFDTSLLEDLVIMKSDGFPTYNFACAIDDALMKISLVIRGDDHLSNTPKQILLYQALDFPLPQFAHLPMILGPDRSPLSKRHGAVSLEQYREEGYLPEALRNYLALLGWGTPESQQFFSSQEMIGKFSLSRVSKSPAVFDLKKLTWMNGQYIKRKMEDKNERKGVIDLVIEHLKKKNYIKGEVTPEKQKWIGKIVEIVGERLKHISQIEDYAGFFFLEEVKFEQKAVDKVLKKEYVPRVLEEVLKRLEAIEFNIENIEKLLRGLAGELNLATAKVIHPLRVILTGRMVTPPLFESMILLGKEKTLQRIKRGQATFFEK
jgi:glutamyl-tRNA synthetase